MTSGSHVLVPFRSEHVSAALRFALSLEGDETGGEDPSTPAEVQIGGWSREEIERAYRESPEGMELTFDGMIDHPDEVLDSSHLASFLTHKPNADAVTVRGTMGAFAHRCASRYKRAPNDFPFRHWYVEGGYARYQMPAAVADILRPLRDRKHSQA